MLLNNLIFLLYQPLNIIMKPNQIAPPNTAFPFPNMCTSVILIISRNIFKLLNIPINTQKFFLRLLAPISINTVNSNNLLLPLSKNLNQLRNIRYQRLILNAPFPKHPLLTQKLFLHINHKQSRIFPTKFTLHKKILL